MAPRRRALRGLDADRRGNDNAARRRRVDGLALAVLGPLAYPSSVSTPASPRRPPSGDPSAPAYARTGVDLDRDEAFVDRIEEITP